MMDMGHGRKALAAQFNHERFTGLKQKERFSQSPQRKDHRDHGVKHFSGSSVLNAVGWRRSNAPCAPRETVFRVSPRNVHEARKFVTGNSPNLVRR